MPAIEGGLPLGPGYKVAFLKTSGPSSYASGGFEVEIPELNSIEYAVAVIANNPGNKLIRYSISGNKVKIQVFTISASTTDGSISATEDAAGTDESGLEIHIVAIGH